MFGHLRPVSRRRGKRTAGNARFAPADWAAYRAHYCAGCHALHEFGGRPLSLLTNYEQTFLLVVASLVVPEHDQSEARPCTALPWRRVGVRPLPGPVREGVSALTVALAAAKLRDDQIDASPSSSVLVPKDDAPATGIGTRTAEGTPTPDARGKLHHRLARWALEKHRARAEEVLTEIGFPYALLWETPIAQWRAEQDAHATLHSLEAPTRALSREVFGQLARWSRDPARLDAPLRRLGEAMGAVVYLLDALVDRPRDRRSGAFNALAATGTEDGIGARRLIGHLTDAEAALQEVAALGGERDDLAAAHTILQQVAERAQREWGESTIADLPPSLSAEAGVCDGCDCDCCPCCDCNPFDLCDGPRFGGCDGCCEACYCCDGCCGSRKDGESKGKRKKRRKKKDRSTEDPGEY